MKYPEYVKNCIEMLEVSGYAAYAVGGAVRDLMLGKEPSDWDITTNATPFQTLEVFKNLRTIPTGIKHGTVTVLFESTDGCRPIEITTFRIDGEYRDSRHPENVEFSRNLHDDLSRRDFTVNAMAYNEKEGIVDDFGGKDDLKNRTIRAVGNPEKRFTEDALRILRAFRFASQLNFEIEQKTLEATSTCAPLLKNIARERIGAEFKKLLACDGVGYSLRNMVENGVWSELLTIPSPNLEVISEISKLKSGNFATRLAALIANCNDAEKEAFLSSLRLSNNETQLVLRFCRVKTFEIPQDKDKFCKSARHFLHLYNNIYEEAIEMLVFWKQENDLKEFILALDTEKSINNPLTLAELAIKGSDIIPLCPQSHAKVGKLLNELLSRVIDNPNLNKKEILMEIIKNELL